MIRLEGRPRDHASEPEARFADRTKSSARRIVQEAEDTHADICLQLQLVERWAAAWLSASRPSEPLSETRAGRPRIYCGSADAPVRILRSGPFTALSAGLGHFGHARIQRGESNDGTMTSARKCSKYTRRGCIPFSWVGRRHDRPSNRGSRAGACFRSSIPWRARRWLPPACRPRARESELRRRRRPFLGIFPARPYCSIRRPQLGRKASRSASATMRPTGTECAATSAAHADCRSDPASRKRLQAHRREPVRTIGMTPVESGRQRPVRRRMPLRKQPQARNHQSGECRARLHDQKYGMRPTRSGRSHSAGFRRFAEKAESRRCLNSYAGSAKSDPSSPGRRIGACRSANSLQIAARSMT